MRKLLVIAFLLASVIGKAQTQDSTTTKLVEIQKNLNSYYNQKRTGTGLFAFGVILGGATMAGLDKKQGEHRLRNGLYGVAAGSAILGLLINMEAVKFIGRASEVSISPGAVTIKF
jgi:hypothetical protein